MCYEGNIRERARYHYYSMAVAVVVVVLVRVGSDPDSKGSVAGNRSEAPFVENCSERRFCFFFLFFSFFFSFPSALPGGGSGGGFAIIEAVRILA